jgi:hypothetical protein
MPANFTTRRYELFWKYGLPNKKYSIAIEIVNPNDDYAVNASGYILYSDKAPVSGK